jgi:Aspartyl protease
MLGLWELGWVGAAAAALFLQVAGGAPAGTGAQQAPPQVVTGTSASAAGSIPLPQLLSDHNWVALGDRLENSTAPDADFYRGILLNRLGKYTESIRLLEPLLLAIAAGPDRIQEKQARLALGSDYLQSFRYKEAAAEYAALEKCCAQSLTPAERDETELPVKLLPALEHAPAQTLEMEGPFTVPMDRNALGVREVEVWVDGYASHWLFDPAANFTMLSRSQAARIGLKLSDEVIPVSSITGAKILVHATVIPQLKFGRAFFRNVPAVIYEDRDLYDKPHRYQTEGVLAQPLLAALGMVTASDDEHLTISNGSPLTGGVPFFRDGEHLVAGTGAKNSEMYVIDPGTTGSLLTSRYYDAHTAAFAGQTVQQVHLAETDSDAPAYTAESFDLNFGDTQVTFREIPVLAKPAGPELDRFRGALREDALDQLESYTFDFRSMRLLVRRHGEQ